MRDSVFAVVDLETTGTNLMNDKIIQFACILVEKGKIVHELTVDINPNKSIPKPIQALTGITNEQVACAPYFEEVAPTIKNMLEDCVFVAHNAYFDFSFLNSELERSGFSPLTVSVLDTVELAQVFFPISPGYRVKDLANYLAIEHLNPHEALSDAIATSHIFLKIIERIQQVPLITLKKIVELSTQLGVENSSFLNKMYQQRKEQRLTKLTYPFPIEIIGEMALRKKDFHFLEHYSTLSSRFPETDEAKEELFKTKKLQVRKPQLEMMDHINRFLIEKSNKNLLVEVPTGVGKSLGYLLPLLMNKTVAEPVVVSTSTLVLQKQFLSETLPMAEKILNQSLYGVILKSHHHYIDLEKFVLTLEQPVLQKQYAIYQMACLVWLLETTTGDLDELTINKNHLFYTHVSHEGERQKVRKGTYLEHDFWRYLMKKKEVADVLIVNHAFLCEEDFRQKPQFITMDYLVIDEAHKLRDTIEKTATQRIRLSQANYLIKTIRDLAETLTETLEHSWWTEQMRYQTIFLSEFKELIEEIEGFVKTVYFSKRATSEYLLSIDDFSEGWPIEFKKILNKFKINLLEYEQWFKTFQRQLPNYHLSDWLKTSVHGMEFELDNERLLMELTNLRHYFMDYSRDAVKWLTLTSRGLVLASFNFREFSLEKMRWYQSFQQILYTGGTLQLDSDSNYFEKQLGLTKLEKYQTQDYFDYGKQAELIVLDEKIDFGNEKEFVTQITKTVEAAYTALDDSILVLFTSHDILKKVYYRLSSLLDFSDIEVLAQGMTGTNEKIVKKATQNDRCIILGAASFWDGIELPNKHLKLLIVTKLPFDPPQRPLVKARYDYLESLNKNPFYEEALPQAGMRLRQGLGRLLRKDTDRGLMILMDRRIIDAKYGQALQNYLPKEIPMKVLKPDNIATEIKDFYKNE